MIARFMNTWFKLSLSVVIFLFLSSIGYSQQKDWLQEFEKEFASSDFTSLYMMLSFSGYSNVGHIAMMVDQKFSKGKIFVVEPNQGSISYTKNISKKDIEPDIKSIKAWDKLGLFKYPSFGGVSYRYYHIEKKKNNKLEIVKYLSVNNPGNFQDKPDTKEYIDLRDFFYTKLKNFALSENKDADKNDNSKTENEPLPSSNLNPSQELKK